MVPSLSSSDNNGHVSSTPDTCSDNKVVPVSSIAAALAKPDESPYYIGFEKVRVDEYHNVSNPEGIIQLGLSENTLSLDLLKEWLNKNLNESLSQGSSDGLINVDKLAPYQQFDGIMELKKVMARFMSEVLGGGTIEFDPLQVVLTCGANPANEILCNCVADPGDAFLVPAPYYPGFNRDMKIRSTVELIPVPTLSSDNFIVTIEALNIAYDQAKKQGKNVKGLLFANPSNPVGNMFNKETLQNLLNFAKEKNIHIISDEIYAGSRYGDDKFISIAEVVYPESIEKDRVHIVYGLSKDLCIPGFRLGVVYSWNQDVLTASKKLTRFCSVPLPIQQILLSMLSDGKFIQDFMKTNQERLRKRYSIFVEGLEKLGLGYVKGSAGLYCWVNMGRLMSSQDEKGELELWDKLMNIAKISVTPGGACHCTEPGWFRCCFARLSVEDVCLTIERIKRIVESVKPKCCGCQCDRNRAK
ncbi:transaminase [Lithospermum erythrorhizon]|uniref:Transaminase n=1 Tax=Lithospermum erythrorhizon TaxID=34254 RepID=A0AAV3RHN5_LITER